VELLFKEYRCLRSSVWDNGNGLEVHGGDGCTATSMFLRPLNYTLKNG